MKIRFCVYIHTCKIFVMLVESGVYENCCSWFKIHLHEPLVSCSHLALIFVIFFLKGQLFTMQINICSKFFQSFVNSCINFAGQRLLFVQQHQIYVFVYHINMCTCMSGGLWLNIFSFLCPWIMCNMSHV